MKASMMVVALSALLASSLPAQAQQTETGPKAGDNDAHGLRNQETGVRGPSGGSPETGPHGQRDPTKDAEPGKRKPAEELRQSGRSESSNSTAN